MQVKTPSYWQEEKYQPLVPVKTAYGHTVQIPKLYEENWESYLRTKDMIIKMWLPEKADGCLKETSNPRQKWGVDLRRVFLEIYKE